MANYVPFRMPKIAYDNLVNKKLKMENFVRMITKRKVVRIPLTKVIIAVSENPITLPEDYVLKLALKKRGKP